MDISLELYYLAWTVLITALMWLPGTLALTKEQGLMVALGNRHNVAPLSAWAERSQRAHRNAVENLVLFAPLVLLADAIGLTNAATEWACLIYFWMRVLHYLSYTAGIIGVRTGVWTVGWLCIVTLIYQILV
jgi:uncharacterized MAPEG superfamily protein